MPFLPPGISIIEKLSPDILRHPFPIFAIP